MDDSRAIIEAMVNLPGLRQKLYLVSRGIPYDVAMLMPEAERWAHWIILGEHESGGQWDFDRWGWKEK